MCGPLERARALANAERAWNTARRGSGAGLPAAMNVAPTIGLLFALVFLPILLLPLVAWIVGVALALGGTADTAPAALTA